MTSARPFDTDSPEVLNTRGNALARRRQLDEAVTHYREALRLRPDFAAAHNNLANALAQQGNHQDAVAHYREALRLRPDLAGAHDNLGVTLKALGRLDEAGVSFREALRLNPGFGAAHLNLANLLVAQGAPGEALDNLRQAVRLLPGLARAHNNLGHALAALGRAAEALDSYREALRLQPHYPELFNNFGNALRELGRNDEAEACYREAVRLAPDSPGGHNNLANILADQGRLDAAQQCYAEAIRLRPAYVEAHTNRAHAYLAAGDYERGFAEYEWRLQSKAHVADAPPAPRWNGEPLAGRTLLVRTEQGFGDTFQFLRFIPLVQRLGCRLVLECEPPLVELLSTCAGIDEIVPLGSPLPPHDLHASLISLPSILKITLRTLPTAIPYLTAPAARAEHWRRELSGLAGFKVGIAWQGNPKHPRDRFRSIPLAEFEPLARVAPVQLISLQVGAGTGQLGNLAGRFTVTDLHCPRDGSRVSFGDTAAIMSGVNLIVTADTSVAHLAGALGLSVWVALPLVPDWRWMLGRGDSPWYSTMRLFRQSADGDWSGPFARMAEALRVRLGPIGSWIDSKD
jgi:tetratricopeptide (TPR) repeat protein